MTKPRQRNRPFAGGLALAGALALGACATPNEEAGFEHVSALVSARASDVPPVWYRTDESRAQADDQVRGILSRPMTRNAAIKLAFLRNPAVQASLAEIGISEADVAQAGRIENPVISFESVATHGLLEINRQVMISVLSLATLGGRQEIARNEAEKTRYRTALQVVGIANDVSTAWIEAVSARERAAMMDRIFKSAKAADDLTRKLAEAGSMTELDQARIKAALAEIAGQRGRLLASARMARERLVRAMGVWGEEIRFKLPWLLPTPPGRPKRFGDLEVTAVSKRLDIEAARKDVQAMKEKWGLSGFTSIVNLLDLGLNWDTERERDGADTSTNNLKGFELEFAIPIFDPGDAKRSRAKWAYMQAVEELKSLAISARSEVREAYIGYRSKLELAHHYQRTLVPLRARISEEELLRYNGMLSSVFDLLGATQDHARASIMAIDAKRDFWMADAHMDAVLLAGSIAAMPDADETVVANAGDGQKH